MIYNTRWLRRLLEIVSARRPVRIIYREPDRIEYLRRYYLFTVFGRTFYLHEFVSGDHPGTGYHNHPWPTARTRILCGEYEEHILTGEAVWAPSIDGPPRDQRVRNVRSDKAILQRRAGDSFEISARHFHWIRLKSDRQTVWTLFSHGPRGCVWGFYRRSMIMPAEFRFEYYRYKAGGISNWWNYAPRGREVVAR